MKRIAATRALRPVRGAEGSKMPGSAALLELEELPPEVVELPLVWSFSTSVLQEVSPLMMPRLEARLKASQRLESVVLDSTLAPPRTSESLSKETLKID
jgi:hypothetical protein